MFSRTIKKRVVNRATRPLLLLVLTALLCGGWVLAGPEPDAVLPDGGRYYGSLVDGKLHGEGRMEWPNGARYQGGFKYGLFSGQGRMEAASGDVYVGRFRDGMMWGKGRLEMRDGSVYTGVFARGMFEGKGRYELPDGRIYEGEFVSDELVRGTYTDQSGQRYKGEFEYWQFNGSGKYTDPEGNVYEGEFADGILNGEGKYTGADGERYEGEFEWGMYHGEGTLWAANGDVFEGRFQYGSPDGEGTWTYAEAGEEGQHRVTGHWRSRTQVHPDETLQRHQRLEAALYSQRELLDAVLGSVEPDDPSRIDLYLLAVAGDGSQEVFRREVEFVRDQFATRFGTLGRSVELINSRNTLDSAPMATATSVEESLKVIAARMDRDEDILFLFMTSHGTPDHQLVLDQQDMELPDLPAEDLGRLLEESGIRWKVVLLSACYSGGFIDEIKDEHTLVITAARHDRTSFGCADENEFVYFGRAFFKEALAKTDSFHEAFFVAEDLVETWEDEEGYEQHSLPQIHAPPAILRHLEKWRRQAAPALHADLGTSLD